MSTIPWDDEDYVRACCDRIRPLGPWQYAVPAAFIRRVQLAFKRLWNDDARVIRRIPKQARNEEGELVPVPATTVLMAGCGRRW